MIQLRTSFRFVQICTENAQKCCSKTYIFWFFSVDDKYVKIIAVYNFFPYQGITISKRFIYIYFICGVGVYIGYGVGIKWPGQEDEPSMYTLSMMFVFILARTGRCTIYVYFIYGVGVYIGQDGKMDHLCKLYLWCLCLYWPGQEDEPSMYTLSMVLVYIG